MSNVVEHAKPSLTVNDLDEITDINVWDQDDVEAAVNLAWVNLGKAATYPVAGTPLAEWIIELLLEIQKDNPRSGGSDEFMVRKDGALFRGHREPTVSGPLISLRRGASEVPRLEELLLPKWWPEVLLQKDWARSGGLVLMAAQTGCGKSTTIAAMIASRLAKFGGHCREIADPCEFPLHGTWGNGRCIQREVDGSAPYKEQFAAPIRDFMRAYPASSDGGRIMVVGEVRDTATAAEVVRNGCNGMLVVTTIHADSAASAIKRLVAYAQDEIGGFELACDMAGSALRCVMSQYLEPNPKPGATGWQRRLVRGDMLVSNGPQHQVGGNILAGKFNQLAQQQDRQSKLFENRDPKRVKVEDLLQEMARG